MATAAPPSTPDASGDDAPPEGDWTNLIRPVHPARTGTMPAGLVLFIVAASLIAATFFSGELLGRKSDARRPNNEGRRTIADAVASVSSGLGLGSPAAALDEAVAPYLGRQQVEDKTLDELLAEQQAAELALPPGDQAPAGSTDATTDGTTPGTTPAVDPRRPVLATPTPDKKLSLWVGGDSLSYELGIGLEKLALESQLFTVTRDARVATGLVRPDAFNWPSYLNQLMNTADPDIVVLMFGANDAQNMPMPPPIYGYELGSEEWLAEYRDRVGKTMDLLRSPKNDRLIVWVGTPPMGPDTDVKEQPEVNYIYWSEAAKRPWIRYFDTWPYFEAPDGSYSRELPMADGQVVTVRARDNIHFSNEGGERVSWPIWSALQEYVDLSGGPLAPNPATEPPPEIVERTEVPPTIEGQP